MDTFDEIKARHEVSAPFVGNLDRASRAYNICREDRGFLLAVIASMEEHLVAPCPACPTNQPSS